MYGEGRGASETRRARRKRKGRAEGWKGERERKWGSRPVPCLNVSQSPVGLQVQTGGTLK